ncbi:protein of unknown function [Xenorhabdus poinarii G6]|uniref:Minor tail T domain-containing protein n=1 Tax=Xenorhabdus poinarii G6 TaxID=1354304 RepID=A0A068R384_9GAMM|nr:protein of unknown function [Xenorhabdus poinarii G6]
MTGFMLTLALRLGKTLSALQRELSASELMLWMAYDRENPLSDRRGDIQAAYINFISNGVLYVLMLLLIN